MVSRTRRSSSVPDGSESSPTGARHATLRDLADGCSDDDDEHEFEDAQFPILVVRWSDLKVAGEDG